MDFPVYIRLGPLVLHPHWVFETLAYGVAFYWYRRDRRRFGDVVDARIRWWVIGAAVVGGLAGSRLLHLIEDPTELAALGANAMFLLGGKTIVGGLIGGLIAVEWIKRRLGVAVATGDLLVLPLTLGIAIGRIGCFLSGLADRTYGNATRLPWGVDFGDGVLRHPTQLYEIMFLVGLAVLLVASAGRLSVPGDWFKLFMLGYMTFRFAVESIKPAAHVGGLSVIQWACLAVIAYYAPHVPRLVSTVRRG
ncbi:MAG TPA: prolipoprotein diacylglyceryl transferase family protein [Vicinamibacterales bacterium]|nr:prolipoprotein diacylglyceryl transferase family protein [Vicinamibacterales bacterium]